MSHNKKKKEKKEIKFQQQNYITTGTGLLKTNTNV